MTHVYFVRHAQPISGYKGNDKDKPLSTVGLEDSKIVTIALRDIKFDYCVCSSYARSISTIQDCAQYHNLTINTDDRFGERKSGPHSTMKVLRNRWKDFNYHEEGGESIGSTQKRNIEGLLEVLHNHKDETILFGTHGTALSSILNYFDKHITVNYFIKIFNWLPYVVHAVFEEDKLISYETVAILNRGYQSQKTK